MKKTEAATQVGNIKEVGVVQFRLAKQQTNVIFKRTQHNTSIFESSYNTYICTYILYK